MSWRDLFGIARRHKGSNPRDRGRKLGGMIKSVFLVCGRINLAIEISLRREAFSNNTINHECLLQLLTRLISVVVFLTPLMICPFLHSLHVLDVRIFTCKCGAIGPLYAQTSWRGVIFFGPTLTLCSRLIDSLTSLITVSSTSSLSASSFDQSRLLPPSTTTHRTIHHPRQSIELHC